MRVRAAGAVASAARQRVVSFAASQLRETSSPTHGAATRAGPSGAFSSSAAVTVPTNTRSAYVWRAVEGTRNP